MKKLSVKQGIFFFYAFDAVLVLLFVFAFLPFSKKNSPRTQDTALFNPNKLGELTAITIARGDDVVFLSQAGAFWTGTSSASRKQYLWPADMQSVQNLLEAAQRLVTVYVRADSVKHWRDFGVDEASATSLTFYGERDSILSQLFFGREDGLTGRIAFRTWTKETVWEVDGGIAPYLSVDESFWADPFILPQCLTGYGRQESEALLRRGAIQNIAPREGLPVDFSARSDLPNGAAASFAVYRKDEEYIVLPAFSAGPAASAGERALLERLNYRYSISAWTFERFQELLGQ